MLTFSIILGTLSILALLGMYRVQLWLWAIFFGALSVLSLTVLPPSFLWLTSGTLAALFFVGCVWFMVPVLRRVIVERVFMLVRKQTSRISSIEKQALMAGNAGFEKGLFSGHPDWAQLRTLPGLHLTAEELAVLNGPVDELCRLTNDFDVRYNHREIPETLWQFVMKHKLFGLRVPKERGGYSLSFQAQSLILGKVASRSVDVATMIELPTSLWPDEIVEKYGTEEQKQYWMPRFAENKEIIAFAVTGYSNGSDATAMRDVGKVEYGMHEGKEVLGVRLNWKKRYITFAPKATLLVMSFQLWDPEEHLKKGADIGITVALIPADHTGIKIGRRHIPTNMAFPNGPIWGEDVFIPVDWIVGGAAQAGQGWRMIMECLFVGRAIALPSASVGGIKVAMRASAMYARIRRQFGSPIGRFEGIEEPLARLAEVTYLTESARSLTAAMVDIGDRPLAVSSLMKYRITEYARQAVNDAMDIHGGRGILDGPSNYLMSGFLAAPVGVTVEGANIVTRSIITFAQGVLQTHPYLYEEFDSCDDAEYERGYRRFEAAFMGHISFSISSVVRAFVHNMTCGLFAQAPSDVPTQVRAWYRQLSRSSASFALFADMTIAFLGGQLKKKQKHGGRLADALSELFMLASALKRFEDDGFPEADYPIVELVMQNGLFRFERALADSVRNFPVVLVRPLLAVLLFPFGAHRKPANDALGHKVVGLVLDPGPVLDRLTRHVYISQDPEDVTGRLEVAFIKAAEVDVLQKKVDLAVKNKKVRRLYGSDWVTSAEAEGVLTKEEAHSVRELEALADRAIDVDHFEPSELTKR
jgi:acyl-CoA dehydrogenase